MPKSASAEQLWAMHLQPIEADNPYVRAAAQFSCIRVFWLQSFLTLTREQWNDIPGVYFERSPQDPQRRSRRKPADQGSSDPRDCEPGTKRRSLFFTLLFLGQQEIPKDCDTVGEPGDVWVTEGAVQVRTVTGWTDWETRWTHSRGLSHPYLPEEYKLTFQPASPSLGYNQTNYYKSYQDWLRLTPDRLRESFDYYLGPDDAQRAAARALSLLTTPSGKELKPYLEICGAGIAAIMYPISLRRASAVTINKQNNSVPSSTYIDRSIANTRVHSRGVEHQDFGAPTTYAPVNPYSLPHSPASAAEAQSSTEGLARSNTPVVGSSPADVNPVIAPDLAQSTSASVAGLSCTLDSQTTALAQTSDRSRPPTPPHDDMMETNFDDLREASPVRGPESSSAGHQAAPLSADSISLRILEVVENLQTRMSALEERLARCQSCDHCAAHPAPGAASSRDSLEDEQNSLVSSSTVVPAETQAGPWTWIRSRWLD